ncbi:MAG: CoB--CoM heterodisulfide reductase iron-sulfur subunit A family protein [Thermoplasmata archaeon]|nr:MAG: CoB--CoM heterodisulfide reductase iron-sulfur subunit A family protein [Thermoplasmata archaeon]
MPKGKKSAKTRIKGQNSALVVGAGVAGIKAALDLAESGIHVILVDEKPYIGGTLSQLDRQFPTDDCGMCKMLPAFGGEFCSDICLRRGLDHPNIDIITNAKLEVLEGKPGRFKARITKKARFVDLKACTACDLCVGVCPVEVEDEFNENLGKRKAIYKLHPHAVPNAYTLDMEHCTRCGECVKICAAEAMDLAEEDCEEELNVGAVILALGFEPFDPSEMGSYHYGEYQNVLTALEFERLMSGTGPGEKRQITRVSDDRQVKNIAFIQCIGSRDEKRNYCSSACCMHSVKEAIMAKELHPELKITVFFMDLRDFGKGYHRYFRKAEKMGIRFVRSRVPGIRADEDKKLVVNYVNEGDEPYTETFDLVILAAGLRPPAGASEIASLSGVDLNKYGFCAEKSGTPVETSRPGVFVCGAFSGPKDIPDSIGEASCSAALVQTLLSCSKAEKDQGESGKTSSDIHAASTRHKEGKIGVFICRCGQEIAGKVEMDELEDFSWLLSDIAFVEVLNYTCTDLEHVKEKIGKEQVSKVIFAACAPYAYEVPFKKAIAEASCGPEQMEIANIREGCCYVHTDRRKATEKAKALISMACEKLGAQEPWEGRALDVVPKALVIGGGISGMTAALRLARNRYPVDLVEKSDALGGQARYVQHTLDGLDVQQMLEGIIGDVGKEKLVNVYLESQVVNVTGTVGAFSADINTPAGAISERYGCVIIATGAEELTTNEFLYGEHEDVISQREMEMRLAIGSFNADSVVMIQCVGLRGEERQYCGRICCSHALKNALAIKEKNPNCAVHVLYRDMMTYGFAEEYYIRAKENGINFIRFESEGKPRVKAENGALIVWVKDPVLNEIITLCPDVIGLSLGPAPDNISVRDAFETSLSLDEDGFFTEANVKFRPVDIQSEGIYICGLSHSPKNLSESKVSAEAAAARAMTVLSKHRLKSKGVISEVYDRWCVGCQACITSCPYEARVLAEDRKVAQVVDALCQGCGVCAVVCPSGAAKLKGYKEKQVMAMIDEAVV